MFQAKTRNNCNVEEKCSGAIHLESERRINGDQGLYGYVNATFVPGQLYMPSTRVTPLPMNRYNTWSAPTTETATAPTN